MLGFEPSDAKGLNAKVSEVAAGRDGISASDVKLIQEPVLSDEVDILTPNNAKKRQSTMWSAYLEDEIQDLQKSEKSSVEQTTKSGHVISGAEAVDSVL